jgi:hypothetical protein
MGRKRGIIKAEVDLEGMDQVVIALLLGLTTDDKQACLDKALRLLVTERYYAMAYAEFQWEKASDPCG